MFRTDEAATFAAAFYGCIFAAVIPVAIEPPATKDVSVVSRRGPALGWIVSNRLHPGILNGVLYLFANNQ